MLVAYGDLNVAMGIRGGEWHRSKHGMSGEGRRTFGDVGRLRMVAASSCMVHWRSMEALRREGQQRHCDSHWRMAKEARLLGGRCMV